MDLTKPSVIRDIANEYGFVFKKGLGQNFITSREILEEIAEASEARGGVIEIGPGFGTLTAELAKRAKKVCAIEIDERLIPVLNETLAEYDNVKIVCGDVMRTDLRELIKNEFGDGEVSVAANLPYYITTPVLTRLIESRIPFKNIVVMVQKEVAARITASPGTKDYGALTVLCRYYTEPEPICIVGAELFIPKPKVDSAVIRLRTRSAPAVETADENMFFRTVKAAFSQRRKTLLNCLAANFNIDKSRLADIAGSVGIDPRRRGETLSLEEFAALSDGILKSV